MQLKQIEESVISSTIRFSNLEILEDRKEKKEKKKGCEKFAEYI